MSSHDRTKYKHKKRSSNKLVRKIRKFFQGFFEDSSPPKEYRPYLGPDATDEQVEEMKFENTRATKKRRTGKRKSGGFLSFLSAKNIEKRVEKRKSDQHKRKVKRKMRAKKRKHERKTRRIDFIRRFLPNYKKERAISIEFSQDESDDRIKHGNYLTYTFNSVILYILAYLLVYMVYQLTVLVIAARWHLDSVLFFYDLQFNDFSPLWTPLNIIIVTISGPVVALLFGILFLRILGGRFHMRKHLKLFMLWLGLHGYNLFLGAFASGTSFDEGFGYVAAWLYLNIFWKILISLIFLFILGWIGFAAAPKFLDTSFSITRVKQQNKIKFLFYQVILSWFIGSLILILVRIPYIMPYDTGNLITMVFAVAPMLFNRMAKPTKNFRLEKRQNRLKWFLFALMVALVLLYRIGLDHGLHIQLHYRILFNLDIAPI